MAAVEGESVGIDLGTTYSCVGVWQNDRVEIIANDQGNRTTPSYVAFTETERLIGDAAKNQVAMNATNTVFDAKRLIGRRYSDPAVADDKKHWPFSVVDGDAGKPTIEVMFKGEKKRFAPEEISSMVLVKMKEIAEAYLGKEVRTGRGLWWALVWLGVERARRVTFWGERSRFVFSADSNCPSAHPLS